MCKLSYSSTEVKQIGLITRAFHDEVLVGEYFIA